MAPRIDNTMLQIYQRATEDRSEQGGKVTEREAMMLIKRAAEINNAHSSSFSAHKNRGNKYLAELMTENQSHFTLDSQRMIQSYMQTGQVPKPRPTVNTNRTNTSNLNDVGRTVSWRNPGNNISTNASNIAAGSQLTGKTVVAKQDVRPGSNGPQTVPSNPPSGGFSGGTTINNPGMGRPGIAGGNAVPNNPPSTGFGGNTVPSNPNMVRPGTGSGGTTIPSNPPSSASGGNPVPSNPNAVRPGTGSGGNPVPSNPNTVRPGTGSGGTTIPSNPPSSGTGGNTVPTNPVTVSPGTTPSSPGATPTNPVTVTPGTNPNTGVETPSRPNPVTGGTGEIGPNGKVILNFEASKKTWGCHWFPLQETRVGGDPINNLYAENGPLHKLDMITGGRARAYELEHNRKGYNAGNEFAWWGHCNNASEAACILQSPKRAVVRIAQDGTQVKFTRNDICGLLVKMTPSLINKTDFRGQRFNDPSRDDPNDPKPEMFLNVMQEWAKDGLPFVLDIDRNAQVWNFPYDKVKISESEKAPAGFNTTGLPTDGSVKYYHIEMSGTGFDEKKRVYECYVQRDSAGGAVASAWIKTPNTHNNPDFMWRPHPVGNIMDRSTWQLRGKVSNPEVDPQMIYDIYLESLA